MTHALDKQIQEYLLLLDKEEKQSLLSVIKSLLSSKKGKGGRISIQQYNQELDDALLQVKGGDFLTQEEVEKAAGEW